jgi:hypothetical protein
MSEINDTIERLSGAIEELEKTFDALMQLGADAEPGAPKGALKPDAVTVFGAAALGNASDEFNKDLAEAREALADLKRAAAEA